MVASNVFEPGLYFHPPKNKHNKHPPAKPGDVYSLKLMV